MISSTLGVARYVEMVCRECGLVVRPSCFSFWDFSLFILTNLLRSGAKVSSATSLYIYIYIGLSVIILYNIIFVKCSI